MVIGCGIPLLLIFFAPSFGIGDGSSLFIFIVVMFGIHLFMPHGSHGHGGHGGNKNDSQNHSSHRSTGHDHSKEESTEKPIEEHKGHHHH